MLAVGYGDETETGSVVQWWLCTDTLINPTPKVY